MGPKGIKPLDMLLEKSNIEQFRVISSNLLLNPLIFICWYTSWYQPDLPKKSLMISDRFDSRHPPLFPPLMFI